MCSKAHTGRDPRPCLLSRRPSPPEAESIFSSIVSSHRRSAAFDRRYFAYNSDRWRRSDLSGSCPRRLTTRATAIVFLSRCDRNLTSRLSHEFSAHIYRHACDSDGRQAQPVPSFLFPDLSCKLRYQRPQHCQQEPRKAAGEFAGGAAEEIDFSAQAKTWMYNINCTKHILYTFLGGCFLAIARNIPPKKVYNICFVQFILYIHVLACTSPLRGRQKRRKLRAATIPSMW